MVGDQYVVLYSSKLCFLWRQVYFCVNYLCLNELIGYADLLDFNKTWPKSLSDVSASKCVRLLQKSKYFSCDVQLSNSSLKIFYCPTLKGIS